MASYQIEIPYKFRLPEGDICVIEKETKFIVDPKCKCVEVSIEK